jgi:iron complex outermembrane receptor protein
MRIILTALTVFIASTAFAQNTASIKGSATDVAGHSITAATVSLLAAKDSSLVKSAVSSNAGVYEMEGLKAGKYLVKISSVNHNPWYSVSFDLADGAGYTVAKATLTTADKKLKDVVVTSKKPMIEVRADRTIFNVENSINATGSTAMELLQKSPGVVVDKDENISMKGKNGVRIYIDGKLSPMSTGDLAAYLRSIQSNDIEAIEMIENPGAKYDASGNAGIINIRLKKNKKYGLNGNANAGYAQGIFAKYNTGVSLNYRNKNINLFSNVSGYKNTTENFQNFNRYQNDSIYDAKTINITNSDGVNVKAGADYFVNSKSTVGVMFNGNYSAQEWRSTGVTDIAAQSNKERFQNLYATNLIKSNRSNTNFNVNYRYADTSGRELNIDADRGVYRGRGNSYQPNYYFDAVTGVTLRANIYANNTPTNIDIYTAKADYEQNFYKGKLGFGGKFSNVKTNNTFDFFNVINNVQKQDRERSNQFTYTENVNAAYVNYNRAFKKFSFQLGVRAEQTNSKGVLNAKSKETMQDTTETVKRDYLDFFPSASVSFTGNPNHQFNLSFSRRIDRPRYQDLNPFENKLDELTYQKGNAFLRPQYTNSFTASHTYKGFLTTALSYSHINDFFTMINDTARKSAVFITQKNLASQDIYSINISSPLKFNNWWTGYANVNLNHSRYKADFEDGKQIRLNVTTVNFFSQQNFAIGKGYSAEVSGWFNTPGVWGGTFKTSFMWSTDAGIQKTVLQNKGTIKLSVTDIFHTATWTGKSDFAGTKFVANGGWESQQVRLNFSYRFGNNQVKAARARKTSIESESNRLAQ